MSNSFSENIPKKFNIFLGEFVNKIINTPSTRFMSKELFFIKKKDYILMDNNLFLPEIIQTLLDDIILNKNEIVGVLNRLFINSSKYNSKFYKRLLESKLFSSIISTSYDYIIEDCFFDLVNKSTPFILNNSELDKISFYKIYGDLKIADKSILSTQDIKRIKILPFYESFWNKVADEMVKNPTILFGINLEDPIFMDILEFILSKTKKKYKQLYLYMESENNSDRYKNFIKKYSVKIINGNDNEFFEKIEEYFPKNNKEGDAPFQGYA